MSLTKKQQAMREQAIGSSEVGVLAGLSRWSTPISIYEAKVTGVQKEETLAMELGVELEEPIARVYAKRKQRFLTRVDTVINPRFPNAVASCDRAVFESRELWKKDPRAKASLEDLRAAEKVLEVKSTTWRMASDWGTPGTDEVPEWILAQGVWQMGVTGVHSLDVAVLFDKDRFEVYRLGFNEELFSGLYEIASRFLVDHVAKGIPPPPDASDHYGEFLARRFQAEQPGTIVEANDELAAQILLYAQLKQGSARLEKTLKITSNWIKAQLGTNEGATHPSFGKLTYKKIKDGSSTDWEGVALEARQLVERVLFGGADAAQVKSQLASMVGRFTTVKTGYRRMHATWAAEADFKTRPVTLALPVPGKEESGDA